MLHCNWVIFGLNKQYNSTGVVITVIVIDRENKIYVIREVTLIEKSDFPSYTINYCKQILAISHDQCLQTQNANICDSQKLNFFQSFYNMGQRPPYVDVLNNRCDRAAICKIRISALPLMIERGRHLNIPRTERYCLLCKSNQIEDEKHFSYIVKNSILKETYLMKKYQIYLKMQVIKMLTTK